MKTSGNSERVVLDTSAYSAFREGHEQVIDILSTSASLIIPTVVLGELEAGFHLGSRAKENRMRLEEFLDEPFVSVFSIDRSSSLQYGRLFAALRKKGTPVPVNDIWISACTLESNATLLTLDSDFRRIPGLSCIVLKPRRNT